MARLQQAERELVQLVLFQRRGSSHRGTS